MSQSKAAFCKAKILELIDSVIEREGIPKESQSFDDLEWIKFHVRDLTRECKDCAESNSETTPSGSK